MKRTTDLMEIKKGAPFTWGTALQHFNIGPYDILSYHPWKVEKYVVLTGKPSDEISFHGWVDGEDVHESWDSLDAAIAGCIAYRAEGANGRAGEYFMKMLAK